MQENKKTGSGALFIANVALRLLVICAFIAALVATVNFITKDKIARNQKESTAAALTRIYAAEGMVFSVDESGAYLVSDAQGEPFGSCESEAVELLADIDAVYTIRKADGKVFGYCVEASPMCFKDEVSLLVAVNPDASAREVQIISLKETKGIGDKVMQSDFLDAFKKRCSGFSDDAAELKGLIIAGATRTSEPVTVAIDTALKQIDALLKQGGKEA